MKNDGLDAMNFTNAVLVGANTVRGFSALAWLTALSKPPPVSACSKMDSSNLSTMTCATVRPLGSGCGEGGKSTQSTAWITPLLATTSIEWRRKSHPST